MIISVTRKKGVRVGKVLNHKLLYLRTRVPNLPALFHMHCATYHTDHALAYSQSFCPFNWISLFIQSVSHHISMTQAVVTWPQVCSGSRTYHSSVSCIISAFESCALLGYYATNRHFGSTYRTHLQEVKDHDP